MSLKVPVTSDDHIQGDEHALVKLVEYGDYECPHCGHAHPVVRRIHRHFGHRLAFVFRNFPLNQVHPNAEIAAEAAEFAATKGRFWEMHDAIFENQEMLGRALLLDLGEKLRLAIDDLSGALSNGTFTERVKADFVGGVRSGVNGTPTFFINGERFDGPADFDSLSEAIDMQLANGTN